MSSMFRILNDIEEVIQENITSYDEAWEIVLRNPSNKLKIEKYKIPVTGLGRDPDLH
mgnify:FL=1